MRIAVGLAALLCLPGLASAQSVTKPAASAKAASVVSSKSIAKPVTPVNPATQRSLPASVKGVTVTTSKLTYVLQRP